MKCKKFILLKGYTDKQRHGTYAMTIINLIQMEINGVNLHGIYAMCQSDAYNIYIYNFLLQKQF